MTERAAPSETSGPNSMLASLSRNRNYRALWVSQLLSAFGGSAANIAVPLLVLAVTHSPAMVGIVLATSAAASLVIGLPAGALVDRWDRKKIMLGCEVANMLGVGSLVLALWWDVASVGLILLVAVVGGVTGAAFGPAEQACLPNLVPTEQLPTAVAMNAARGQLASLSGTALGGFLFAIARFVPFAADVLTRVLGLVALLFLHVPEREVQPEPLSRLGHEIAAGVRWMWRNRPIRVIGLFAIGLNLFFAAYFIIILVLAQVRGVPSGTIGVMVAMMGVGGILGSLLAPYFYQKLSPYLSIIGVFWALTLLAPLAVFTNNGYIIGVLLAAMGFLAPTANTSIITYQLLLTPDDLRGRMSSAMGVFGGTAAVIGPALGGFLMEVVPYSQAVLVCAAGIAVVTVLGTINPTLRQFPRNPTAAEVE